jgi:hypothetical protein
MMAVDRKNGKPERGRVDFSCWERRRPGGSAFMKTNVLVSDSGETPALLGRKLLPQDSLLVPPFFLTTSA